MNFDISAMDLDTALQIGLTENQYLDLMKNCDNKNVMIDDTLVNKNSKEEIDVLLEIGLLLLELKSGLPMIESKNLSSKDRYKRLKDYYDSIGISEVEMIDLIRGMKH